MKEIEDGTSVKEIDKNVIHFLTGLLVVSVLILIVRFTTSFPCDGVKMDIAAKEYRVGELISFVDYTEKATKWKWDFGDDSEKMSTREVLHAFDKPGEYNIKLLVNNTCDISREITIKEKLFVLDSTKIPTFKIPVEITLGQLLEVKGQGKNAETWEWRFGETAKVNSTRQEAVYRYRKPGLKTISLVMNGDILHAAKKRIRVVPKEEKKESIYVIKTKPLPKRDPGWDIPYEPETKKKEAKAETTKVKKTKAVPYISEPAFEKRLLRFAIQQTSEKQFVDYFCGDIDKTIIVNSKKTSFLLFCQKIKGRSIDIKQLTIFRKNGSNCIQNMNIVYKK